MAKSGQQPVDDDLQTVEEFDVENVEPTITQKIDEFIAKQKLQDASITFYLYKYDDPRTGETKSLINKYQECDPPDEDDIGREFGSGRYLLMMTTPRLDNNKTKMRAYRFRVHPRYDQIMKNREQLPAVPAAPAPAVPQVQTVQTGPSFNDMLGIVERMFTMISPILNRPQNENVVDLMNQSYGTMGAIMKKSLMEQFSFMSELSKSLIPGGENMNQIAYTEDDEIEETGGGLLEQLAPLLSQFLPLLLGGGPQAQMVSGLVKQSPQFKEVVKNQAELNRIIEYLDQAEGPEKTDQILQALRVKRVTTAKRKQPTAQPQRQPAAGGKKK